jgi:hypothetical protein
MLVVNLIIRRLAKDVAKIRVLEGDDTLWLEEDADTLGD